MFVVCGIFFFFCQQICVRVRLLLVTNIWRFDALAFFPPLGIYIFIYTFALCTPGHDDCDSALSHKRTRTLTHICCYQFPCKCLLPLFCLLIRLRWACNPVTLVSDSKYKKICSRTTASNCEANTTEKEGCSVWCTCTFCIVLKNRDYSVCRWRITVLSESSLTLRISAPIDVLSFCFSCFLYLSLSLSGSNTNTARGKSDESRRKCYEFNATHMTAYASFSGGGVTVTIVGDRCCCRCRRTMDATVLFCDENYYDTMARRVFKFSESFRQPRRDYYA